MRKCRRSGMLCLLLACAVLFMGTVLPFSGRQVSAYFHANSRQMTVGGTSVNLEQNRFANGTLRFTISLGGCSTYKSATLSLILSSEQIPILMQTNGGTRYADVSGGGRRLNTTATAVSANEIVITTSNRELLDGQRSMSFSVPCSGEATIAGASVTSVEEYKETINQSVDGNGTGNTARFSFTNMTGTSADLEFVSSRQTGGTPVNINVSCS